MFVSLSNSGDAIQSVQLAVPYFIVCITDSADK